MQVITTEDQIEKVRPGIGLGNFDGLHIGHMALLSDLLAECHTRNVPSMLYTFREHPANLLNRKKKLLQILTLEKKIQLLSNTELEYVYLEDFDEIYAGLSPEQFVKEYLVNRFAVSFVVVGFNFTFGKQGTGTVDLLKELGRHYGFDVRVVPPVKIGTEVVSSTMIRNYVKDGNMERVRLCTGRYYSIYGVVKLGRQIGSSIGFPTANISPEAYLVLPGSGVYITQTILDGQRYNSITNIGNNPTFGELENLSCETHIFGREGNLYGKRIEVFFMAKLRGEVKFEDKDALCRQIHMDIIAAREFFHAL